MNKGLLKFSDENMKKKIIETTKKKEKSLDIASVIEKLSESGIPPIYSDVDIKSSTKYPSIINFSSNVDKRYCYLSLHISIQDFLEKQEYIFRSKFCKNTIVEGYFYEGKEIKDYEDVKKYMYDRLEKSRIINKLLNEMEVNPEFNKYEEYPYLQKNTLYDLFETYLSELDKDTGE